MGVSRTGGTLYQSNFYNPVRVKQVPKSRGGAIIGHIETPLLLTILKFPVPGAVTRFHGLLITST